ARRTRSSGAFCSAARPRGCSRRRRRRLLPTRTSCSSAARTRWNTVTWATRIDLLSDTNPEIRKIVRALRAAAQSMTFDFVAQVDDDSFVNLPILFEILEYLPKERVYVGNMIDTVPQRGGLSKIVTPEYSVNIYLAAPSKGELLATLARSALRTRRTTSSAPSSSARSLLLRRSLGPLIKGAS
ncbi:unnamed protein product, partial [Prorocentrum cordatum]